MPYMHAFDYVRTRVLSHGSVPRQYATAKNSTAVTYVAQRPAPVPHASAHVPKHVSCACFCRSIWQDRQRDGIHGRQTK